MANWKYIKLGDECLVERGGSPRPIEEYITTDESGINWIKIGDTTDSMFITSTAQKIIPEGQKKSRNVFKGDFLLSNSMSFGRPYILKIDGCIHDGWLVIRDYQGLFNKHFLYYFLSAPKTYEHLKSLAVGGVVNNLNTGMVKNLKIPLPTLQEQKEIADKLDKLEGLLALRKQQLSRLDQLVKARFVEMFGGETATSPLENSSILITKGASPKWQGIEYTDSGTLFVTSENVREGYLDLSKKKYLDNKINEIQPRSILKKDDILINIVGASIGRAAIFTSDELANINQAVALVRINQQRLNLCYLVTYLNSPQAIEAYDNMKKGGARDNLSLKNISELPIPIASLSQQEEFATFVQKVDKTKAAVKQSLEKLETLKKSLMQEYFG